MQERVGRIQELREALREEATFKNADVPQKCEPCVSKTLQSKSSTVPIN